MKEGEHLQVEKVYNDLHEACKGANQVGGIEPPIGGPHMSVYVCETKVDRDKVTRKMLVEEEGPKDGKVVGSIVSDMVEIAMRKAEVFNLAGISQVVRWIHSRDMALEKRLVVESVRMMDQTLRKRERRDVETRNWSSWRLGERIWSSREGYKSKTGQNHHGI